MTKWQKKGALDFFKRGFLPERLWVSYKTYMDPLENFTDFQSERGAGKMQYEPAYRMLCQRDQEIQVFIEVYGMEDDENGEFIYADTMVIFSELPLKDIEDCFKLLDEETAYGPDEVGRQEGIPEHSFILTENGTWKEWTMKEKGNLYFAWWD